MLFRSFMKNPNKRIVLKTRLCFTIILGIATGYLYLLDNLKKLGEVSLEKVQEAIIQIGLLNINLGYIELYTFFKIFSKIRYDVFIGILIFVIFISLIIICGKMIKGIIMLFVNSLRKYINYLKEERRIKEELIRLEKQAKLEKEIYDEICNIQKIYQEKEALLKENFEEEKINTEEKESNDNNIYEKEVEGEEENDTSIQISEEKRDLITIGISTAN